MLWGIPEGMNKNHIHNDLKENSQSSLDNGWLRWRAQFRSLHDFRWRERENKAVYLPLICEIFFINLLCSRPEVLLSLLWLLSTNDKYFTNSGVLKSLNLFFYCSADRTQQYNVCINSVIGKFSSINNFFVYKDIYYLCLQKKEKQKSPCLKLWWSS